MQETFHSNLADREVLLGLLRTMADDLMARVRRDGLAIRTVTVKVRYPDFSDESHAATLPQPTDLETDVYPHLAGLLRGAWSRPEPLRLISLRFSNVGPPAFQPELPLDATATRRTRQQDAARLLDALHARDLPLVRAHAIESRNVER
jgi:DNA polymerase-4